MKLGWTVTAQLLALKTSAAFAAGDVIKFGVLKDHSEFDDDRIVTSQPGKQVFRPMAEGGCPLVTH